jgi:hypothetical protein
MCCFWVHISPIFCDEKCIQNFFRPKWSFVKSIPVKDAAGGPAVGVRVEGRDEGVVERKLGMAEIRQPLPLQELFFYRDQ